MADKACAHGGGAKRAEPAGREEKDDGWPVERDDVEKFERCAMCTLNVSAASLRARTNDSRNIRISGAPITQGERPWYSANRRAQRK